MKGRTEFPYEEFVVGAVEAWLATQGYERVTRSRSGYQDADLRAEGSAGRFVIEAKGETTAIGTDFNTGFGQIVKHMDSGQARYALAVPDTEKFRYQVSLVPDRVRAALQLWWLFVAADDSVKEVPPGAKRDP